jgi:hypothetical protein
MARVAPGEGGDRDTTGTRSGSRTTLSTGDVLLNQGVFVVTWHHTPEGLWIALPVIAQHGPLHRSHVILSPIEASDAFGAAIMAARRDRRLIILTGQPMLVSPDATRIGAVDLGVLIRVKQTIVRAQIASAREMD